MSGNPVINPCQSCTFGTELTDISGSLETMGGNLKLTTANLWDSALYTNSAAKDALAPDSDTSHAERAQIDRMQSHALDTTAHMTNISDQITSLSDEILVKASNIDCSESRNMKAARMCPKLLYIITSIPTLQALLDEASDEKNFKYDE